MSDYLEPVLKRDPQEASRIREQALRDPLFRSACQDYCDTYGAIQNWRASSSHDAEERIAEFSQILKEIAAELEEALTKKGSLILRSSA